MKIRSICALVAYLAITGCSKGTGEEPLPVNEIDVDVNDNVTTQIDEIYGSWTTGCFDNFGRNEVAEWEFSADQMIGNAYVYESTDTACSEPVISFKFTYGVTYLSELQETALGTAVKYDLNPLAYSDSTGFDSSVDGMPVDVVSEYRIALISDGNLYGGDLSTGNGLTNESRPTELDQQFFLTK